MVKLPTEVQRAIEKTMPTCIATASAEGIPNIVYVTYLKMVDENTVVIADNKFDKTRKNLDANPRISFTVLDPDSKKSYQVKGRTECVSRGSGTPPLSTGFTLTIPR